SSTHPAWSKGKNVTVTHPDPEFKRDPKPPVRVKDGLVYAAFHAQHHRCLHCDAPWPTAAHLLRGVSREDVLEALVPLCGGGSSGCHGAFDSGHSYHSMALCRTVTPEDVKASVAEFLRSDDGEKHAAYLIGRL